MHLQVTIKPIAGVTSVPVVFSFPTFCWSRLCATLVKFKVDQNKSDAIFAVSLLYVNKSKNQTNLEKNVR